VVLSVLLAVVLVGWFTFDVLRDRLGVAGCTSSTVLTVIASPDIAPIVTQVGRRVTEEVSDSDEACYRVRVTGRESANVAESLAVADGSDRPDVWIPDSTQWLQRAQDAGAWNVPVAGTSVATSPVVLAVAETAAFQLGWPNESLSWAELIGPGSAAAKGAVAVGLPDPAHDPVGVAALFGLRELVRDAGDPETASTVAMRKLSANTVPERSELFARLPGVAASDEPLSAFPASENAVLAYNAKQSSTSLVAVYADPAINATVPALDFPYVVLPDTPDAERAAAGAFLDRLLSEAGAELLADAGFRTPEGKVLRDRPQDRRTSATPLTSVPAPNGLEVERVLNSWAAVNLSGRLQVLLDVSGSMSGQVPGTGKTRMETTVEAAVAGIGLFKPTTKLGLWLFSTRLDGARDYRVLLPMRPLSEQLASGGVNKLRSVRAQADGNTALYDAVLAAYRDGVENWEPGRINTVVVMTDGKDDNASDISRAQLLTELRKLQNPRRPLKLIGIGIGPDADKAELTAIAKATGGQAFLAANPTKIGDVFYAALSLMLCQPPACQPDVDGG
jgi:ABC-type molybdate transport system substrate-binding protein